MLWKDDFGVENVILLTESDITKLANGLSIEVPVGNERIKIGQAFWKDAAADVTNYPKQIVDVDLNAVIPKVCNPINPLYSNPMFDLASK